MEGNPNSGGPRLQVRIPETPRRQTPRVASEAIVDTRVVVSIARGFRSQCLLTGTNVNHAAALDCTRGYKLARKSVRLSIIEMLILICQKHETWAYPELKP